MLWKHKLATSPFLTCEILTLSFVCNLKFLTDKFVYSFICWIETTVLNEDFKKDLPEWPSTNSSVPEYILICLNSKLFSDPHFNTTSNILWSFYVTGLLIVSLVLLSSVCRHNDFRTITWALIDLLWTYHTVCNVVNYYIKRKGR